MKKFILLSLLFLIGSFAKATVDCTSLGLVSEGATGMTISLPTSPSCDEATYVVSVRVHGSGLPFTPVSATVSSPSPGDFIADLSGLEPCTEYDILVEVFCAGELEGGCVTGIPFKTSGCDEACAACDFSPGTIEVTDISECRKGFVATGASITFPCEITGYTWDFGAYGTATGAFASVVYDASGTYEACVTITYVNADGEECAETICTTIEVVGCEDACEACDFSPGTIEVTDISECRKGFVATGASITFPCEIIGYDWDFGDMNTASGSIVSHEYTTSGTYEVCVTITYVNADGEECTETICTTVVVEGCVDACEECRFDPGSIVVSDISDCRKGFTTTGSSITFPCEVIGYDWDFGDMNTASGSIVSHEYTTSGTYEVCVTITYVNADGEECTETICTTVVVEGCVDACEECRFDPGSIVVSDISDCRKGFTTTGSSITFPCEVIGYDWDFGDMNTASGSIVSHEYTSSGIYEVCVTITYVNAEGEECTETICTTVVVEGCVDACEECRFDPGRIVVADISDCRKGFTTTASSITAPCSVVGYDWDFGDMTTGSGSIVIHDYTSNGIYEVCVTITYVNGEGEVCEETICTLVEVTGCGDGVIRGGEMDQGNNLNNSGDHIQTTTVPNPADHEVTITVLDPSGATEMNQMDLIIFDINGREVHRSFITAGAATRIDVSQLQTGMYIYEIRNSNSTLVREKLIIK